MLVGLLGEVLNTFKLIIGQTGFKGYINALKENSTTDVGLKSSSIKEK